VKATRYLTPYLLLGILTLGTGLAIGLGLSQGPATYNAGSVRWTCSSSLTQGEATVSCDSAAARESAWSPDVGSLPRDITACMFGAMETVAPAAKGAAYGQAFVAAKKKCGFPRGNGTWQHFFENTVPVPTGYASCRSNGHKSRLVPLGSAAFKKATTEPGESCFWDHGDSAPVS
jgi:hypothetical protein